MEKNQMATFLFRRFRIRTAILMLYMVYCGHFSGKQLWRVLLIFGATSCRDIDARIKRAKEKTQTAINV